MEEFVKSRQIEELKDIKASEEHAESVTEQMELNVADEAVSEKRSLISRILKGEVRTKTGRIKENMDKSMLAIETLKKLIPGIPEGMTVVSGMSEGAIITEPPKPVALRRRL